MAKYSIWVVSPMSYSHSKTFFTQAIALESGFKELGHECRVVTNYWDAPDDSTCIILGANLLSVSSYFPKNPVIFNLEQITPGSSWITDTYIELLKSKPVWDYSKANIAELAKLGVANVKYCGIGYAPELSRIPKRIKEDIDVLFFGSINERRANIMNELGKRCDAVMAFDKYGDELDHLIGKAKVVLNMHYFDSKVFEITRCQLLLSNKKCVVSEFGGDIELEQPFYEGVCFGEYDELIDKCMMLLQDDEMRKKYEEKGFESFSRMKQSNYLIEVSEPESVVVS